MENLTFPCANAEGAVVPLLSDDKNGPYVLTANMRCGTNATSYTVSVTGKPKGTYVCTVQFANAAGSTTSVQLTVK